MDNSFLKINNGVENPGQFNEKALKKLKKKKKLSVEEFVEGIFNGDRTILSQAITLVESKLNRDNDKAQLVIEHCLPRVGKSMRIGITGVPGVGKSTFIEALGKHITALGRKLAVIAIDPSSTLSKGSILGDKTRMEKLATDPNAFIRPSPSAGTLGGVARKTREIIILCEAAGFDTIFVETVGVGQSEILVQSMVDFFLLLMLAGAGDELQGIKRGIMEIADAIIINKADGDNIMKANIAKGEIENAVHIFPMPESGWKPSVSTCSSKYKTDIDKVWELINRYFNLVKANGYFKINRDKQIKSRMYDFINTELSDSFYNNQLVREMIPEIEAELMSRKTTSYAAARKLLYIYFKGKK
ncbi:MAG: methylmalonyl Co-A mutase-associated GTPase MeaB [Bacteroidales bacterium]|nr:methylmalonyl Co-A mutase-associated GTPase MeaB [Bacteroidales bacterium]